MADRRINELPEVYSVYDETLLAAEQQGVAVKITAGQLREGSGVSEGGLNCIVKTGRLLQAAL